jgi:histidyl-tRNA synthetase
LKCDKSNLVEISKGYRMDLRNEIINHVEWMENVASLLGSEEVTEEEIQALTQHDKCALGKWLDSEASNEIKALPEFESLVESHSAFHKLAGNLITAVQLGKEADALESHKQFIEESQKVVGYLQTLQESISEGD